MKLKLKFLALFFYLFPIETKANEIGYQRLSPDESNPFYDITLVGEPREEFIAFLYQHQKGCNLSVKNFKTNETIINFIDSRFCPFKESAEDAYEALNAIKFKDFISTNSFILNAILYTYKITPDKIGRTSEIYKKGESKCMEVGIGTICSKGNLEVELSIR